MAVTSREEQIKQFELSYEAFIDAFSGASGGVIASLVLYPIENFRTRIQAMDKQEEVRGEDKGGVKKNEKFNSLKAFQEMVAKEGLSSFYKGL